MLIVPFQMASGISRLTGHAFGHKFLTGFPAAPTLKGAPGVLAFALIELVTLGSIMYAAVATGRDNGVLSAMLSGTTALMLLHALPAIAAEPMVGGACRACEPLGKFCVGLTALAGVAFAERLLNMALTHRQDPAT